MFDFKGKQWNNETNMEWDKFSEKALLKLLPFFLIIKSAQLIWRDICRMFGRESES